MKKNLFIFIFFTFAFFTQALAGNGNRGGGHFRYCADASSNPISGYYFFDYLQTRQSTQKENDNEYPSKMTSCFDQTKEIADKLMLSAPELGMGLKDFVNHFGKKSKAKNGSIREWKFCDQLNCLESQEKLDPKDLKVIPKNCKQRLQLAVRDDWDNKHIVITVDKKAFQGLVTTEPKQCSYFLIHEWLRDFVTTDKIAEINRYLHSDEFFLKDSPQQVRTHFPKELQVALLSNCPINQGENKTLSQIKSLEDSYLKSYFELIKSQSNDSEAQLKEQKMIVELRNCLRKSQWPHKGLFTSKDFGTAGACFNSYSPYIPYAQCLKMASEYDQKKRDSDAQMVLFANCQDGNWGKMTAKDCSLYNDYMDSYKAKRTVETKKKDIQRCITLSKDIKGYQGEHDLYKDRALNSPIKLTEKELAEKISTEDLYARAMKEQLEKEKKDNPEAAQKLEQALEEAKKIKKKARRKFIK